VVAVGGLGGVVVVGGMGDAEVEGGMLGEVSGPELDPIAGQRDEEVVEDVLIGLVGRRHRQVNLVSAVHSFLESGSR
jgi:hypothetical protein